MANKDDPEFASILPFEETIFNGLYYYDKVHVEKTGGYFSMDRWNDDYMTFT